MSIKKRILFSGEASFLSTGFSTYYRELLPRLVATGKYEIAEHGSYARQDHPEVNNFIRGRWKFYGNLPLNDEEAKAYNHQSQDPKDKGQNINQFGAYKFDGVCADFKPDICIDIRDNWMLRWQLNSVFRPWVKVVWMPTVDALPQHEDWIKDYEQADLIVAYADFGIHTLKQQSPLMRVFPKAMRPGVDLNTFKPMDRDFIRQEFCLSGDMPIIGSVMRNQSRKLYPDLLDAFARMKNKYKGEKAVDKAVLLLHTAWPDNAYSYDYPRHIMRLQAYPWFPNYCKGIKDSVLQTLMCHNPACGKKSVAHAITLYGKPLRNGVILLPCMWCGQQTATCPTTGVGFNREELAKLYNLMDLYVQCSICEGDGMPLQEAKACGKPALMMDYSAMREKGAFPKDYIHFKGINVTEDNYSCHKGGEIIKVGRYYSEPETSCMRALPDVDDLAAKMRDLITNDEKRLSLGRDARKCVEDNYDWDKLSKQWEFVLDGIKTKDRTNTWESPIVVKNIPKPPPKPEGLQPEKLIEWLYLNVLKYPQVDPEGAKMWLTNMQSGMTEDQVYNYFSQTATQSVDTENNRQKIRAAVAKQKGEDYTVEGEPNGQGEWI